MIKNYFTHNESYFKRAMKKIFIVLLIFSFACETTSTTSTIENQVKKSSKTIRNPSCEDITSFQVFQVLDNFVLATVCQYMEYQHCLGHTVYFQKEKGKGKIYFDDQIIKVKDNECVIFTGTYRYKTQSGYKTVPIVKIIDSQIPNEK